MKQDFSAVGVLAGTQFLYQVGSILMMAVGVLASRTLTDDPALGGLPLALTVLATLAGLFPASFFMKKFGRRPGFLLGTSLGFLGSLLLSAALMLHHYVLFAAGCFFYGLHQAFLQYVRFAAMEAVPHQRRAAALSWILVAGIPAAFLGTWAALWGKSLIAQPAFLGAFVLLSAVLVIQALLLFFAPPGKPPADPVDRTEVRPLSRHLRNPALWTAILSSTIGYALMVMLMAAAPVAMKTHGHDLGDSTLALQFHVLGMYIPSFFSGVLLKKIGPRKLIAGGCFILILEVTAALSGLQVPHFVLALVLLGVGWNFLFVGGTGLLVEQYRPAERTMIQALNDTAVFSLTALATFGSSYLEATIGWHAMNLLALPFLALVLIAVTVSRKAHPFAKESS